MQIIDVARDNWNEVKKQIAQHGVLNVVRVRTHAGDSYDLFVGNEVYRIPEELAQDLVSAGELSAGTYDRMYLVGFQQRE